MTVAELETAMREHARVIALGFDNQRYGTIRARQERRGTGQGVATELGPVDSRRSPAVSAHVASGWSATPNSSPRFVRRSRRSA